MNQEPIGSSQQPMTEADLHQIMRSLAKAQSLTEHMLIEARGNRWHVALSLLRRDIDADQRSRTRKIVDFLLHGLRRDAPDGVDVGGTLVEDLPLPNRIPSDVVVSWADSKEELRREVESIRGCLDALGIFNEEEQKVLQEVHVEHANLGLGEVSVKLDKEHHQLQASGDLKIGRLLALVGHYVPGLGKANIGGTLNFRSPYNDSRDKFVAALMALQVQSGDRLATCSEMHQYRNTLHDPDLKAEKLQNLFDTVDQGMSFLRESLQAIDREMTKAYQVMETGSRHKFFYDVCMQSLEHGKYAEAIELLERIQHPSLPIKQAMGENFYLFAANVIMQAQLAAFGEDLARVAKDRFGVDLQKDTDLSPANTANTTVEASAQGSGPIPPAFQSRRPGRRP